MWSMLSGSSKSNRRKKYANQPRPVAIAIAYAYDPMIEYELEYGNRGQEPLICLVSSRKHGADEKGFMLPKGGIKVKRGESPRDAALRELFEEAGVKPLKTDKPASKAYLSVEGGPKLSFKAHEDSPTNDPTSDLFISAQSYSAFEIPVDLSTGQLPDWKESDQRVRVWKPISEAADLLAWRPDVQQILFHSRLGQTFLPGRT